MNLDCAVHVRTGTFAFLDDPVLDSAGKRDNTILGNIGGQEFLALDLVFIGQFLVFCNSASIAAISSVGTWASFPAAESRTATIMVSTSNSAPRRLMSSPISQPIA
jgi:hypothetical protein